MLFQGLIIPPYVAALQSTEITASWGSKNRFGFAANCGDRNEQALLKRFVSATKANMMIPNTLAISSVTGNVNQSPFSPKMNTETPEVRTMLRFGLQSAVAFSSRRQLPEEYQRFHR